MSASWALFDCTICGTSRTVVTSGTFIATFFFKTDGVLLGGVEGTDETWFTSEAVIDIQVSARLAIFGLKTSDSGSS